MALITGASGALGAAFSRQLMSCGYSVVVTGRDLPQLLDLVADLGAGARAIAADLRKSDDLARILAEVPRVDLLVNAAGAGVASGFSEKTEEEVRGSIELNLTAVALLCRHYGRLMVEESSGMILNIASVAALRPCPGLADYAAAKAFIISLSRSLAAEWRQRGVTVTCCIPGPIKSDFAARAGLHSTGNELPAELVAALSIAALDKKKTLAIVGRSVRLTYAIFRLLPERIQQELAQRRWRLRRSRPK